jgi:hypothetical protein
MRSGHRSAASILPVILPEDTHSNGAMHSSLRAVKGILQQY